MIRVYADETTSDSDKVLTVPAGMHWKLLSVFVAYTASATGGNRDLVVEWRDAADVVLGYMIRATAITASQVPSHSFHAGAGGSQITQGTRFVTGMPLGLLLPPGFDLHGYDAAAIDASADDLLFRVLVDEFAYGS